MAGERHGRGLLCVNPPLAAQQIFLMDLTKVHFNVFFLVHVPIHWNSGYSQIQLLIHSCLSRVTEYLILL
jgi:hypothetical protein